MRKNKTVKRGKRQNKVASLNIFSNNAASLKSKLKSFKHELKQTDAGLFTIQETHFPSKGKVEIENYEIFKAIRKTKEKGGTMIGAHKALKPVLIMEYNETFELLVIEINVANKDIRIISGYGPQENWSEDEKKPFFEALEEEVTKAELAGKSVFIEADFNSKLGPKYIPNDPHTQTNNGKRLAEIIERQKLVVANGLNQCEGTITRERVTLNRIEKSAISFVLVSEDLVKDIELVKIDEKREHVLNRITKTKKKVVVKESDHNVIVTKMKLSWNKKIKEQKNELFNLKNKECQNKFKEETTKNNGLSKAFEENEDLDDATNKFMKTLNKIIHKCFRKIKIKKQKPIEAQEQMYNRWKEIKSKTDPESKLETEQLEEELADDYFKKIKEAAEDIECEEGGEVSNKIWKLKRQLCPNSRDPPTAMKDSEGNLITSEERIKELALDAYEKRLENRPMKKEYEHIRIQKETLAEKILKVAETNKTKPWTRKDLDKVLAQLKKDKSRDPFGLANEIFKPETAGNDLKEAILKLMNRIKDEQKFPKMLEKCNISSIWKQKGPRNEFKSYRGIFRVAIFRTILDKLIYNDEYKNIDSYLSDCNVGGRKSRNIRDNIFALNAILNSRKGKSGEALDIQVFDVKTCFDSLWLHEVILCLYKCGMTNDKLPLLFLENANAEIAVKTPGGISKRKSISNIIMQGSVWGSLCCVVLMDKLAKQVYADPKLLYYYKGIVEVPTLQMVDDILSVQKCSPQSLQQNTAVNTFMDLEKLQLNEQKCHKIHVGKNKNVCQNLNIHGKPMKEASETTYLGDKITNEGNIKANIKARIGKGHGKVKTILAMLKEAPLGWMRVKSGMLMRTAMLVNGIMFNSEDWHGVTMADVSDLERVDEALLRGVVDGHSKIPLAALYLETGQVPIRFIWASRRILYLQTILKRDETELIHKIYKAQKDQPKQGDFIKLLENDMKILKINKTDDEIKIMSKAELKKLVKENIQTEALIYLKSKKSSKMDKLEYNELRIQQYLASPLFSREEASLLLALRTRTVRGVRSDFSGMLGSSECPLPGCVETDTLGHILECPPLLAAAGREVQEAVAEVQYTDAFSRDINGQKAVTMAYSSLLRVREGLVEGFPVTM